MWRVQKSILLGQLWDNRMKVRELIELLQKENPESDIRFMVQSEVCQVEQSYGTGEVSKYIGQKTYYEDNWSTEITEKKHRWSYPIEGVWIEVKP